MSKDSGFRSGMGVAFRLGAELLVATILGALMGYAVDYFLNIKPWFLVLGIFFGGAAGSLNAYRVALELGKTTHDEDEPG